MDTQHLCVATFALPNPAAVESELIALASPSLNLTGWDNPDRPTIKAARKQYADFARQTDPVSRSPVFRAAEPGLPDRPFQGPPSHI